jgi:hypothetical protein
LPALDAEFIKRAVGKVVDTKAVFKTGVVGGGVDELHRPKLANVSQPLDSRGVE